MKRVSTFIVKSRYVLLGVFLLLVVASCIMMQHVNINYNLMQYLDKNSTSTVALEKMEDEFGSIGQCQVLVTNVSFEEGTKIKDLIEGIDGVSSVIFASSKTDTEYYNQATGDALYKVFLTTGNFDTASYQTLEKIRNELNEYTISMNGGSVESEFLTNSLERDMVIIILIVVAIVFLILMMASSSYVEPFLFLLIAGGAILINMGTNMLLNTIPYIGNAMSFITKSIAAVMQLALSMDYAIVLLHAYKEEKEKNTNQEEAMIQALCRAFAPVSASSITTIAGLVALMFMSFSIGFDVGLVLAKGILISLLCVFFFMPGMLLLFDNLLVKTAHRPIDRIVAEKIKAHHEKKQIAGKKFFSMTNFQNQTKIIIPILAAIIFVVSAVFNFNSCYSFTLQASTDVNSTINVDDKKITDEFGIQNTLVVLIEKNGRNRNEIKSEEEQIIAWLKNYQYEGKNVINSAQGYSTYGVYNDLTAEQFASIYLDQDMLNANIRGINVLYSNLLASGLAYLDQDNNIKANVYDVIKYAKENEGAKLITEYSETLIDQLNQIYFVELTAEQFATANSINQMIVNNVYSAMSKDKATTYEVLEFIVNQNYAQVAFNSIQSSINTKYNDLLSNNIFEANGAVNETMVNNMKNYCNACESGSYDLNDENVQSKYTQYKTITADLNQSSLMSEYPFITVETANLLLNGNNTIANYLVIQSVATQNIATLYGQGLQATISNQFNEIPVKDEVITRAEAKLNYGIDDITLDNLYRNVITNCTLIKILSDNQYYLNPVYQTSMQDEFDTSYDAFANFESENYIRIIFNFDLARSGEDSFGAINEISNYLYGEYDDTNLVSETFVYSQIKNVFNQDIITVNIISFVAILLIIAVTFKSAFTPILLTLLIQGAIWVTMGISTLMGNEIFFICYMVVMCVQMGATIDYGILLTSNYINNRKKYSVKDSMSLALSSSISTILTSGSILVLSTLIIGLVSKVSIVSDLGLLLSRGCLISVLMIVFVLPQCLMICDKIIEKTSIKTKFNHNDTNLKK